MIVSDIFKVIVDNFEISIWSFIPYQIRNIYQNTIKEIIVTSGYGPQ